MKFFSQIIIFVLLFVPATARAQVQGQQQSANKTLQVEGLSIDPFLIEIDAEPGQTIERSIKLGNTTDQPLSFIASINDFVPDQKTGQAIFLESNEDADPRLSLSRWITITKQPEFTIPARSSTEVVFSISTPSEAEPGTHYGGILFGRPPGNSDSTASLVQHKVGAIILLRLGKSQEQMKLKSFSINNKTFSKQAIQFTSVLENAGNVHSKPKGEITLRNIFGKQVAQLPINKDANIVLPQSSREFTSLWSPRLPFGRYTAEAVIYYGNPKLELRTTISFWVLPIKELGIILSALILLVLLLRFAIRRYNQYIINQSK